MMLLIATFEAQFTKNISNTETLLKKAWLIKKVYTLRKTDTIFFKN